MTWKLSRVHVDMRVYFDIGCKTLTHRVGVRFVLVAVSVLAYGQLSIIIPLLKSFMANLVIIVINYNKFLLFHRCIIYNLLLLKLA